MIKIENFLDFNYKPIAFDISNVDKDALQNFGEIALLWAYIWLYRRLFCRMHHG